MMKNDEEITPDSSDDNIGNISEISNESFHVSNLDKIPQDTQGKVKIHASIQTGILRKFYENTKMLQNNEIEVNWDDHLAIIIADWNDKFGLEEIDYSLSYDGRTPRKDVLLKLQMVAETLEKNESFPYYLKRHDIEVAIRVTLGNLDSRTERKYFECITDHIRKLTGKRLGYCDSWNCSKLLYAINKNLEEL